MYHPVSKLGFGPCVSAPLLALQFVLSVFLLARGTLVHVAPYCFFWQWFGSRLPSWCLAGMPLMRLLAWCCCCVEGGCVIVQCIWPLSHASL